MNNFRTNKTFFPPVRNRASKLNLFLFSPKKTAKFLGSELKKHQANKHGIDVVIYKCYQADCSYTAKTKSAVKNHNINIHEMKVDFTCFISGCEFVGKNQGHLRKHIGNTHNE